VVCRQAVDITALTRSNCGCEDPWHKIGAYKRISSARIVSLTCSNSAGAPFGVPRGRYVLGTGTS